MGVSRRDAEKRPKSFAKINLVQFRHGDVNRRPSSYLSHYNHRLRLSRECLGLQNVLGIMLWDEMLGKGFRRKATFWNFTFLALCGIRNFHFRRATPRWEQIFFRTTTPFFPTRYGFEIQPLNACSNQPQPPSITLLKDRYPYCKRRPKSTSRGEKLQPS